MKRVLITMLTAVCGAALMAGMLAPTAEAAPYTPREGVVFNNSSGGKKASRRIQTTLDAAISAVPGCPVATPGCQKITMAMYLFREKSTTDRLIAAHKRGVSVRFLIDDDAYDHPPYQLKRLKRALGTNKRARSFVTKCYRACGSDVAGGTIHLKFYLFSRSGLATNVSMIPSSNPHRVNIYNSFNNSHTIPNNPTIYNGLMDHFAFMITDPRTCRTLPAPSDPPSKWPCAANPPAKTLSSGIYQLTFFPQRPVRVQYLEVLNTVQCRVGSTRTVVRMSMWGFTNPRMDVARKLWQLHNAGCRVDVTLNRGRASRTVMRQLLVKSPRYGQMLVEDAWKDKNRNDYAESYTHHKAMIISGWVEGKSQSIVYSGSQNLTSNGTYNNDDMTLRVASRSQYLAYSSNFSWIERHAAKRLRKTPPPIKLRSHRGDALSTNNIDGVTNINDGG